MNAEILSASETCTRKGYWSLDHESRRLHPTEILRRAIAEALTSDRPDRGEHAGEIVMGLSGDRGIDCAAHQRYDVAVHHAALADILTSHLAARGPFSLPKALEGVNLPWEPKCLSASNGELRRIVLVDHWSEDREFAESRSWFTLAEMAAYKLPMTLEVLILGASSAGKRHSAWTKGLLHPRNLALRFKKKTSKVEGFKESWVPIWREDHGEISREDWLQAMERDGVLQDLTKRVHIKELTAPKVAELRGIIERKMSALYKISELPDPNFSACDYPKKCQFQCCCFAPILISPEETGLFVRR